MAPSVPSHSRNSSPLERRRLSARNSTTKDSSPLLLDPSSSLTFGGASAESSTTAACDPLGQPAAPVSDPRFRILEQPLHPGTTSSSSKIGGRLPPQTKPPLKEPSHSGGTAVVSRAGIPLAPLSSWNKPRRTEADNSSLAYSSASSRNNDPTKHSRKESQVEESGNEDEDETNSAGSLNRIYEKDLVSALKSVKLPPELVDEEEPAHKKLHMDHYSLSSSSNMDGSLLDQPTRGFGVRRRGAAVQQQQQQQQQQSQGEDAELASMMMQHPPPQRSTSSIPRHHFTHGEQMSEQKKKKRHSNDRVGHVHHDSSAGPATSIFPKGYDWRGGSDLLSVISYASSASSGSKNKSHPHGWEEQDAVSVQGPPAGGFQHYVDAHGAAAAVPSPRRRRARRTNEVDPEEALHLDRWDAEVSHHQQEAQRREVTSGRYSRNNDQYQQEEYYGHTNDEYYQGGSREHYPAARDEEERYHHHSYNQRDQDRRHHHDLSSDDGYVSPSSAAYHRRRRQRRVPPRRHHQDDRAAADHYLHATEEADAVDHYRPPRISHHYAHSISSSSSFHSDQRHQDPPAVSTRARPSSATDTKMIEISPGVTVPLRGAAETRDCIRQDFFIPTQCCSCTLDMFVVQDAAYVLCPMCRVVNPMSVPTSDGVNGGLGLGFTMDELASIHQEIMVESG